MNCTRSIVLPLVCVNGLLNVYLLYRVVNGWMALSGDAESEWEGGGQYLARSLSATLVAYLLLATTATMIGFHGVYKRLVPSVRLYLQFSFADFAVCSLAFVILVFNCYNTKEWKDNMCENLSTHPDILRALRTAGYDIESCESWVEQFVFGGLTMLAIGLVLKLQFILVVVSHYTSLAKANGALPSIFTTSEAPIRLPTRKTSRAGLRDRHHSVSRSPELPPYSDSPSSSRLTLLPGQQGATRTAPIYEMEVHSSSSGEDYTDSKRRE